MRGLGPLEGEVMDVVWAAGTPLTVRDVLGRLERGGLAYTTVMTVLDKLHRKGWLTREPVGRAYAYRPVQTREAYCAQLMSEVLGQSDDPRGTLLRFVAAMPADIAADLEQALRERAAGR